MSHEIFDLMAELELLIVDLYTKTKTLSRLRKFIETFQMMETVSENHSHKIREVGEKVVIQGFDRNAVIKMHKKMRDKLWDEIINESDENQILKKMAVAEESTGKLYFAISAYYEKISEQYKQVADEIKIIATEEFEHRDGLLKLVKY